MSMIRIQRNPSRRQLLVFGACWLVFFGIVGAGALRSGAPTAAAVLGVVAAVVPLAGWASPRLMRWVFVGTTYLALPVGFVVSYVILAVVYYCVLAPTGLLMRLLGHDPLQRRFDPKTGSYWVPRPTEPDTDRYFRQF